MVLLLAAATVAAPSWALTSDWTGAGAAIPGRSVNFDNTQAITINDYSTAGPYPSTVTVPAFLNEPITDVAVRVKTATDIHGIST